MRNLESDDPAGVPIESLENRRHTALFDQRCDLKTFVEKLTDLDLAAQPGGTVRDEPLRSR